MEEIPYESGSYYVFDRGYNAFKSLYQINILGSYFVVRAKKNLQYKSTSWKRRLPPNVLSDARIRLSEESSFSKYPTVLADVNVHTVNGG